MTPRRETRAIIEQALATHRQRRRHGGHMSQADLDAFAARLEKNLVTLRGTMDPRALATLERKFRDGIRKISVQIKRNRRRPDDGGMPALVEPPRGPLPLQGGAEAPLEFDS